MISLKFWILGLVWLYIFTTKSDGFSQTNINDYGIDGSNEILRYSIIKPHIHAARSKRSILNISKENSAHIKDVILTYQYKNETIKINLHLNQNILTEGYLLSVQSSNGTVDYVKHTNEEIKNLCNYQGIIDGKPNSSVAVSICDGNVNGVVFDEQHTFFIHSPDNSKTKSYLIKSTDLTRKGKCGVDANHHHSDPVIPDIESSHFKMRQKRSVKPPYNSNEESLFVELMLVFDNSMYKFFNNDIQKIHEYSNQLVNILNIIYQKLNVFIGLVEVKVWTETDEIAIVGDSDVTIDNFVRHKKKLNSQPHDVAVLLTNKKFNNEVFGKAYIGTICSTTRSAAVVLRDTNITGVVAGTIAHEMGHNFGMNHDENFLFCSCESKNCIMSGAYKSLPLRHWSACSKRVLAVKYGNDNDIYKCLRNKPQKLFKPSCGNGFVEPDEECDCGSAIPCKNICCNADTCKLTINATCATGECCDLRTCQLKEPGIECRWAKGECDLPEHCTGNNEYCPDDVFKKNGHSCDYNESYCYNGLCGSRKSQCQKIWGHFGRNQEPCYELNLRGNTYGHCGQNYFLNVYNKCDKKDLLCGLLQCSSILSSYVLLPEAGPELYSEHYSRHVTLYSNESGFSTFCHTVEFNNGPGTFDVGMTPNGAKCGVNMMCVNQKCVPIHHENSNILCPQNCNGNGKIEWYVYMLIVIAVLLVNLAAIGIIWYIFYYKKKIARSILVRESTEVSDETSRPLSISN